MQDEPELFSAFLMWLLADLYHDLPEVGDTDKPKLVFFFDETHLLFKNANQGISRCGRTDGSAGSLERSRDVLLHPKPYRSVVIDEQIR